jgi:hypothetical protein
LNPEKLKSNVQKFQEPGTVVTEEKEEDLSPAVEVEDVKPKSEEEAKIEEVSDEVLETVVHNTISSIAADTVKAQEEIKEEIKQNKEEIRMSAFEKLAGEELKAKTVEVAEIAGYYTPKKKVVKDAVSKDTVSKLPEGVVTAALKELTGKGASEITGTIDLHVKADAIVKTVAAMITRVKELTLEKIPGFNVDIFDNFISNDIMRPVVLQEKSVFNFRDIRNKVG